MRRTFLIAAAGVCLIAGILAGMGLTYRRSLQVISRSILSPEYEHHYLFLSTDRSEMTRDIFEAAQKEAEETGAILEWGGRDALADYSLSELIEIGIASGVDGIILCPDGEEGISQALRDSKEAGIPVVTFLRDVPDSDRVSFVGISYHQLGEMCGEDAARGFHEGVNNVCLLDDALIDGAAINLIRSQMIRTVSHMSQGRSMKLTTVGVDSSALFELEELIRSLLFGEKAPDVLICLTPVQTECALQALIDYNMVARVQLIGYYAGASVLSALRRDLIPAVVTVDTQALGRSCVRALTEYLSYGHVSDYFNIPLENVRRENLYLYQNRKIWSRRISEENA